MERHVLVVLPHPDDETFGTGGTIAKFTKEGVPVTYACGTLGEMGRNMGRPFFATRERLPLIRKQELIDACEVLGITDLRLLGLRDKTVEFENKAALAERIANIIRDVNPSLIITHYPGHGVHPDHNALGAATVAAVALLPVEERPVVYAHAITRDREEVLGAPDVTIDIRPVWETKLAAIRAHRSQSEAMLAQMEAARAANPAAQDEVTARFSREVFWTYKV